MSKRLGYRGTDGVRRRVKKGWTAKVSSDARQVRLEDQKRVKTASGRRSYQDHGGGLGSVLDADWDEEDGRW